MQLAKRAEGKENDIIVRILSSPEYALADLRHADHGKKLAFNIEFFAQWLFVWEKFLGSIMANNNDRSAAFIVDVAEPAAGSERNINYILIRAGISFENCLLGLAVLVLHRVSSGAEFGPEITHPGGDRFYMRQILHRHGVVIGKFLARAHFFCRTSERKRFEVKRENDIGAKAGNDLTYVVVQPAHNRRNSNHDGNANHDAEHGQRRTQLVAADGIDR